MSVYTLNIVGESYRQDTIKRCREGECLILKREAENKYDENAVAVLRENGEQIGYISMDDAEWVARIIDEGNEVEARIKWITGGKKGKPTRGVVIDVNTTPALGWEESRERRERKGSVAYVRDGKMYEGEVTSSAKEALDALIKVHDTMRDTLGGLSGSVDEKEKEKDKTIHKGFWRGIFGG